VQVVFQNPRAALDPRSTVLASVSEPLRGRLSRRALRERVAALLDDVGLGTEFLSRYPHELSGGQSQRVCIARALAPGPQLLLLDEPTSALDVSVQAQVIELLRGLRSRYGLAYLLVSHDLSVVQLLCDRIAVMRAGQIVEEGATGEILRHPRHSDTRALVDAVLPPRARKAYVLPSERNMEPR
jgi:ABC-type glutathione transport system ATPase component